MAGNTGKSFRKGQVSSRSQIKVNGRFIKRDTKTGRFISSKKTKYKGVRTEKPKNT